jgi:hypothetical protein
MPLHETIGSLIARRAPQPVCDACLADYLALSRKQVFAASLLVRSDNRFRRFSGVCSGCCTNRKVTTMASA